MEPVRPNGGAALPRWHLADRQANSSGAQQAETQLRGGRGAGPKRLVAAEDRMGAVAVLGAVPRSRTR